MGEGKLRTVIRRPGWDWLVDRSGTWPVTRNAVVGGRRAVCHHYHNACKYTALLCSDESERARKPQREALRQRQTNPQSKYSTLSAWYIIKSWKSHDVAYDALPEWLVSTLVDAADQHDMANSEWTWMCMFSLRVVGCFQRAKWNQSWSDTVCLLKFHPWNMQLVWHVCNYCCITSIFISLEFRTEGSDCLFAWICEPECNYVVM